MMRRFNLLDAPRIVRNGAVFSGLFVFAYAVFASVSFLVGRFVHGAYGLGAVTGLSIGVVILGYDRVREALTGAANHYLFHRKINFRELLKEGTQYLARLDSLDRQARLVVAFLIKKGGIRNASIFVFTFTEGVLLLGASRPRIRDKDRRVIRTFHPLIQYLYDKHNAVRIEEMRDAERRTAHARVKAELGRSIELMAALSAEVAVPCFGSELDYGVRRARPHLRGILFLGPQASGEPYTVDDLDVFFTLAQESSIAFQNARLYDEAVHRSSELERINRELDTAGTKLMRSLADTEDAKRELERTQAEMLDMKRRELVARLAAALGHEIKNPLQSINFTFYHFEKVAKLLEELHEYGVERSDSKVVALTEQLRTLALDRIAEPLKKHSDRIKGIANSVTDLIKGQDRMSDIHLGLIISYAIEEIRFTTYWERLAEPVIAIDIPKTIPLVRANAERLQGVFVNLIKNAYDAMRETTERKITIRAEEDPDDAALVRLHFSDTGAGMDEETVRKAFDFKFTTKGDGGTGIGLAYAKDTIEAHGGTISVTSAPRQGTEFVFTLRKATAYGEGGDIHEKNIGHRR